MKKRINHYSLYKFSEEDKNQWQQAISSVTPLIKENINNEYKNDLNNLSYTVNNPESFIKEDDPFIKDIPPVLFSSNDLKKIKRNIILIQDKLDLHYLTATESYVKIKSFLYDCYIKNKRWVLIITGKGKHINNSEKQEHGVLRELFMLWIQQDFNIYKYVISYNTALPQHGGKGAFYIHIKKHTS